MASELHVDAIKLSGGTSALTIDSSGNVNMPGSVVQTVDFSHETQVINSSTSYASSGLTGSITPKFNNSKMFITAFINTLINGDHDHGIAFKLIRSVGGTDTTVYTPPTTFERYFYDGTANTTPHAAMERFPFFATDTPNTTNAVTYTFQFRAFRTSDNDSTRCQSDNNRSLCYIQEIAQ